MSTVTTEQVLNNVEAISDDLMFFVQCFGFLLPRNSRTNPQAFAELIKKHFDISNPKTQVAVSFLETQSAVLIIETSWQGFSVYQGVN